MWSNYLPYSRIYQYFLLDIGFQIRLVIESMELYRAGESGGPGSVRCVLHVKRNAKYECRRLGGFCCIVILYVR